MASLLAIYDDLDAKLKDAQAAFDLADDANRAAYATLLRVQDQRDAILHARDKIGAHEMVKPALDARAEAVAAEALIDGPIKP